ncbi:MAG: ATPase [Verrucomicrobia bacterium]|nr:ATPase [Verrucomicrobiota bacterium]
MHTGKKDTRIDNAHPAPLWHNMTVEAVCSQLQTTPAGLNSAQYANLSAQHGPNELQAARGISPWSILLQQFSNVLIVILLIATVLSAFLGHGVESVAIAIIVLFAVGLGFIQEYRAEVAIEALRKMAAPTATVLRDGKETEIPARDIVPGDIIMLKAGDKVPADARLVESVNLQTDEATLTGESTTVGKNIAAIAAELQGIADRTNMVFAGTAATYGRGRAVAVATGMNTEFGKIARMLQSMEQKRTPLQDNLDKVGSILARAALVVVVIIVLLGLLRGQPFVEMLVFGIALAVAVVPEALPAVVTISLAIGLQRMAKRHALVRRLPAVETLGSTSVICSDKTGTLTKDEMTAKRIFVPGQTLDITGTGYEPDGSFMIDNAEVEPSDTVMKLLQAGVLASDTRLLKDAADGRWHIAGDPTEGALIVAAAKAGIDKKVLDKQHPRTGEIPFSSETKRMTTVHASPEGAIAYSKGAPEVILESCTRQISAGNLVALSGTDRDSILQAARQMANDALRVLALACKPEASLNNAEREMVFLGLVGMIDPPRPEAKASVQKCAQAGIRVVMMTGDHPATAQAVARELGILNTGRVVLGSELESLADVDLDREVDNIDVYARVSPAHKLRVVAAFQRKGHVVAMTGDGVNDAPALKMADIGVAMGITGTDVSKEASAMMLTDDNFASIVSAVEEGRGIFSNIKKYLMYLLSSNIGEIGLMAAASLAGMPLPLTAVQLLCVNLATDGLPALALAVDPPESDLMARRPRNPRVGIFTRPVITLMSVGGFWSSCINFGLFAWALNSGRSLADAMTMTFASLVLIQFIKAYNFRSDRNSVFHRPFANKWLNISVLGELVMLILIVHIPFLQVPFATTPLSINDWMLVAALSITVSPVLELAKWMERRGWFGKMA